MFVHQKTKPRKQVKVYKCIELSERQSPPPPVGGGVLVQLTGYKHNYEFILVIWFIIAHNFFYVPSFKKAQVINIYSFDKLKGDVSTQF